MGTFLFASLVHTPDDKREKIQELLESWSENNTLSADIDGLDFFDDWAYIPGLEFDDPEIVSKNLSEELGEPSFVLLICDSDYAYIEVYDNEEYAKMTLGEVEMYDAPRENDNIELFSKYLIEPYTEEDIKELIEKEYDFVDEGVYDFFEMCGIKLDI